MLETDENEFTFFSKHMILHPKWNSTKRHSPYDLCLIETESISAEATRAAVCQTGDCFSAACLPDSPPKPGKHCWVAGYGNTNNSFGSTPDTLLEVGVNIMDRVK